MKIRKKTFWGILWTCFYILLLGNKEIGNKNKIQNDSLLHIIQHTKKEKVAKDNILKLLNSNFLTNPNYTIKYVEDNILNQPKYMSDSVFYAEVLNTYAVSFFSIDLSREIEISNMAINYIGNTQSPKLLEILARIKTNLAHTTGNMGHRMTQLKMYEDLSPLIHKVNKPIITKYYNFRIGLIYYLYNDLDKALNHLKNAIFTEPDLFKYHPHYAAVSETVIASIYLKLENLDSIKKYTFIARDIQRKEFPLTYQARVKNLLALCYAYENKSALSNDLLKEGALLASKAHDTTETNFNLIIKGKIYEVQKKYHHAIDIYSKVLNLQKDEEIDSYKGYILKDLIRSYKEINNTQKAYETYDNLLKFLEEEKTRNSELYLEELNYNFKYHEKISDIERLKIENEKSKITKERNNLFILALIIILVLLSVTFFLIIKNYKRNKVLSKQKYALLKSTLEEEKRNKIIDEMKLLKQIENRERNRIGTDLHDSVGGLLSSVKIALYDFQESRNLSLQDLEDTNRILSYIDDSKQEINRIVYNLTPLIVEKFGLIEAIKQYCKKIQSDSMDINLQLIGMQNKIILDDEITIYRIIQEIMHNIVKHAHASHVLLQLQSDNNGVLIIQVEDDGVGMEINNDLQNSGLGLKSIYSRVNSLNGRIKIDSKKGLGTIIHILAFPKLAE